MTDLFVEMSATVMPMTASSLSSGNSTDVLPDDGQSTESFLSYAMLMVLVLTLFALVSATKIWFFEGPAAQRRRQRSFQSKLRKIKAALTFQTVEKKDKKNSRGDSQTVIQEEEDKEEPEGKGVAVAGADSSKKGKPNQPATHESSSFDSTDDDEMSESEEDDEDGSNTCQICLSKFHVGDNATSSKDPSCVHKFHVDCLAPWLLEKDECPLCRQPYVTRTAPKKNRRAATPGDVANPAPRAICHAVPSFLGHLATPFQRRRGGTHTQQQQQANSVSLHVEMGSNDVGTAVEKSVPSSEKVEVHPEDEGEVNVVGEDPLAPGSNV